MGKAIRLLGFTTSVSNGETCASACALAWLGGSQRHLTQDSRVGFHAAYLEKDGRTVESGVANALVGAYVTSLGLSSKAVVFVAAAPPDKMQWLTPKDRTELGIEFTQSLP